MIISLFSPSPLFHLYSSFLPHSLSFFSFPPSLPPLSPSFFWKTRVLRLKFLKIVEESRLYADDRKGSIFSVFNFRGGSSKIKYRKNAIFSVFNFREKFSKIFREKFLQKNKYRKNAIFSVFIFRGGSSKIKCLKNAIFSVFNFDKNFCKKIFSKNFCQN